MACSPDFPMQNVGGGVEFLSQSQRVVHAKETMTAVTVERKTGTRAC